MTHVFRATIDDVSYDCISFLDEGELPPGPPQPLSIVARVAAGAPITIEALEHNPMFLAFLHSAIAMHGPSQPALVAAALRQRTGYLYVLDMRTPSGKEVTMDDVIGVFTVDDGRIGPNSYVASGSWRALSASGMFRFPTSRRARDSRRPMSIAGTLAGYAMSRGTLTSRSSTCAPVWRADIRCRAWP